jgi:hypothetical protein
LEKGRRWSSRRVFLTESGKGGSLEVLPMAGGEAVHAGGFARGRNSQPQYHSPRFRVAGCMQHLILLIISSLRYAQVLLV